ncbi:glycosyltransferase family protein [Nitritalea halalkaliphila]|nr:hypothetical protein [Nitritalea halalkaliphila]
MDFISLGEMSWKPINFRSKVKLVYTIERLIYRFLSLGFDYPDSELFLKVKKQITSCTDKFDAVISIAVPYAIHWGVASVWSKIPAKNVAPVWIADCGDPFYGSENDSFKLPFYWAWVEKWFMRKADFIAVPTPTSHLGYFPEFHPKIKVISQGFKFEDYSFQVITKKNTTPVFAYAGLLIPNKRDPRAFCEYLLSTGKDFRFHIYTKNYTLLKRFNELAPDKFILHSFMPRVELLRKLKEEVDFVVNFENSGPRQTPSKLIDYILIDKPILSVNSSELDFQTINEFLEHDYGNALNIPDRDQYKIENVTSKFLDLID